jgi:hypothetical protein
MRYRITLSSEALLVRFLATKLLQRKRYRVQHTHKIYLGHAKVRLDKAILRSFMMLCPRALADPSNGIDVVDASEFGDGGFEGFHLLVPVRHIHSIDPCDFALLVELVCEGLSAFGVTISDEDLGAATVLVWARALAETGADPRPTSMVATSRPMPLAPPVSFSLVKVS